MEPDWLMATEVERDWIMNLQGKHYAIRMEIVLLKLVGN